VTNQYFFTFSGNPAFVWWCADDDNLNDHDLAIIGGAQNNHNILVRAQDYAALSFIAFAFFTRAATFNRGDR